MPKGVFLVGLSGAGKSLKAEEMEKSEGYAWVEGIRLGGPAAQVLIRRIPVLGVVGQGVELVVPHHGHGMTDLDHGTGAVIENGRVTYSGEKSLFT